MDKSQEIKKDGKQFLEELFRFETEIHEKQTELSYWKEQNLPAGALGDEIAERTCELEALIREKTQKKLDATRMIDQMTDPIGRAILRYRYILCRTWAEVADACGGMSERNAHYIHDSAIREFEKLYAEA